MTPISRGSQRTSALKQSILLLGTAICAGVMLGCAAVPADQTNLARPAAHPTRPDILLIVADDLGYSDIGAFGGEIVTPNLDRLAQNGLRLTNMHVAPTCSPTRAMLLTGVDAHRVGLGAMAEMPMATRAAGYEGYLLRNNATIAERLSDAGYTTAMAGKWHLGRSPDQWPAARGFQRSFALLDGGANHFGMDQTAAWSQTKLTASYVENQRRAHFPKGRYSSDVYADRMIDYIRSAPNDRPFFGYLAFTAPHWPLQAPAEGIAKYAGRYDKGPEAIRAERLERMKSMGIVASATPARPLVGYPGWDSLSPEQKSVSARQMAIYAAMVEHMDRSIGRVLAAMEAQDRLKNTVVIFLSDNGADDAPEKLALAMAGAGASNALGIDNSYASLGSARSFTSYGPVWAQVSSTPFSLFKGYTTEGGVRVPMIVSGSGVAKGINDALLHATDMTPTLARLAGMSSEGGKGFHGASGTTLLAPTGHSMTPIFNGRAKQVRKPREALGTEFMGGGALWKGSWKLTRLPPRSPVTAFGEEVPAWRLYDLAKDPGETRDTAGQNPERVKAMLADWADYLKNSNVIE